MQIIPDMVDCCYFGNKPSDDNGLCIGQTGLFSLWPDCPSNQFRYFQNKGWHVGGLLNAGFSINPDQPIVTP